MTTGYIGRKPTEEQTDHILRIMKGMKTAKSEPSEKCTDDGEHKFEHRMHGDGAKTYFNLFECTKCGEWVKVESERTGEDAAYWADDEEE